MKAKHLSIILTLFAISLLAWSCAKEEEQGIPGVEVTTANISVESQFFSFAKDNFVTTYDLVFSLSGRDYLAKLNSAAGVQAAADTSGNFASATLPETGYQYDTTGYHVVGDGWMDATTYNPVDHSIGGNGTVYFIRGADYVWVKLEVLSASPSSFVIKYALDKGDGSFGDASIDTVSYSGEAPAHYDFTSGNTVEPEAWDLGFITIPVYAPGVGTFYMPSVHVNYEQGIKVAILEDVPFEDLSSIPDEITWLEDVGELRNLGYLGPYEILVYHPEPPYNHKVIVEHLNRVYVVEAEGQFYKIRFLEYSSGVLLFEYAAL